MKKEVAVLEYSKYQSDRAVYDVVREDRGITLQYSKLQSTWTHPGSDAYALNNTGNCFQFVDYKTGKIVELDYCQAEALRLLLRLEDGSGTKLTLLKEE